MNEITHKGTTYRIADTRNRRNIVAFVACVACVAWVITQHRLMEVCREND